MFAFDERSKRRSRAYASNEIVEMKEIPTKLQIKMFISFFPFENESFSREKRDAPGERSWKPRFEICQRAVSTSRKKEDRQNQRGEELSNCLGTGSTEYVDTFLYINNVSYPLISAYLWHRSEAIDAGYSAVSAPPRDSLTTLKTNVENHFRPKRRFF